MYKLKSILSIIVLNCLLAADSQLFSQISENPNAFPDDVWGVYSWFGLNSVSRTSAPHIKGVPLIYNWKSIEPENGKFDFENTLGKDLEKLDQNDFYTFISIWVAFATSNVSDTDTNWAFTPKWLFSNGVPLVEFPETVNPLGETTRRYFPYYFDEDYKFYFHRMIDSLGNYICNLPPHLKKRVLFIQSAEGSTGDGDAYKGTPIDSKYEISKEDWSQFRIETWSRFKNALSVNGELQVPILTNYDSNKEDQYRWMLDSLPKALGLKNGMLSHGYHISDAQERIANFELFRADVENSGKTFFARGEQDAEWKTYGWSTQNPKQAFYWSALYATHGGLSMWNVPWEACLGETYSDAIQLFNRNAAKTNPATSGIAFCALRRGLDASDTREFPENIYGVASKSNTQRYINIADSMSKYGANQGDPEKATGGGMINRKREDYNDVGWKIVKGNYRRHITQIDPEETSLAWWQVDTSIYGRFARGFDAETGRNTMYFDVDDMYFKENRELENNHLKIRVIYRADDAGSWLLKYHAKDSSMKVAMNVSNEVGEGWAIKEVIVEDALLDNGGDMGADLILQNIGGTNCRFHMIELLRNFEEQPTASGIQGLSLVGCPGVELKANSTHQLSVELIPENASDENLIWSSSNENIAKVDSNGLVTTYAQGMVEIAVSTPDSFFFDNCNINVTDATIQTPYEGINHQIPGLIEGEHYDLGGEGVAYHDVTVANDGNAGFRTAEGVDIVTKSAASNGMAVAHPRRDEWLEYSVDVSEGLYDIVLYYFCNRGHGDIELSLNGIVLKTFTEIQLLGDWDTRDSVVVENIFLKKGQNQILRLTNGGEVFIDAIEFLEATPEDITNLNISSYPASELNLGDTYQMEATYEPDNAYYNTVSWASLNPDVVSVDDYGLITAVAGGTATIRVSADSVDVYAEHIVTIVEPIYVQDVSIKDCPTQQLALNTMHQLAAEVTPANASDLRIVWSTSNWKVATVNSQGQVYGTGSGDVTITATSADGVSIDHCQISVYEPYYPVTDLNIINCPESNLEIGHVHKLEAGIFPENASDKSIEWKSSNEEIAIVDNSGYVLAVSEGEITITVSSNDTITEECTFMVVPVAVTSITVSGCPGNNFKVGQTIQLSALVMPLEAENPKIDWVTSNPEIATVDSTGLIVCVSPGEVEITAVAVDGGFSDKCSLIVDSDVNNIHQNEVSHKVQIYPNPVKDILYFNFNSPNSDKEIEIYNIHGQMLLKQHTKNDFFELNISKYSGETLFIIKVISDQSISFHKISFME